MALIGVTSARAVFWTIPTRFLTGAAAAGGLAFINTIGTTGGFVGPYMMGALKDQTGSFLAGHRRHGRRDGSRGAALRLPSTDDDAGVTLAAGMTGTEYPIRCRWRASLDQMFA